MTQYIIFIRETVKQTNRQKVSRTFDEIRVRRQPLGVRTKSSVRKQRVGRWWNFQNRSDGFFQGITVSRFFAGNAIAFGTIILNHTAYKPVARTVALYSVNQSTRTRPIVFFSAYYLPSFLFFHRCEPASTSRKSRVLYCRFVKVNCTPITRGAGRILSTDAVRKRKGQMRPAPPRVDSNTNTRCWRKTEVTVRLHAVRFRRVRNYLFTRKKKKYILRHTQNLKRFSSGTRLISSSSSSGDTRSSRRVFCCNWETVFRRYNVV